MPPLLCKRCYDLNVSDNKETVRQYYRQVRLAMMKDEAEKKNSDIGRRLLNEVNWAGIRRISAFRPISRLKEVDITSFVEKIMEENSETTVDWLGKSRAQSLPAKRFDLILVPCLAFDPDNYRLGWGGGFYDRFLADQPEALKVGLAYRNGLVRRGLPREPHDIPLDMIITEH